MKTITDSILRRMRRHFFDINADGILVCLDPVIGPLESPQRGLSVRLNARLTQLELLVRGSVEQVFELGAEPEHACCAAFGAYFTMFERSCRHQQESIAA